MKTGYDEETMYSPFNLKWLQCAMKIVEFSEIEVPKTVSRITILSSIIVHF